MSLNQGWVPMKWPCGPLGIALRSKSQSLSGELKGTLDAWAQPAALELLRGSPINCLIVDWAHGVPEDSAQQKTLKPLVAAGGRMGISFVGKITARGSSGPAVGAARESGISAILLEAPASPNFDFPTILQFPRDKVQWETTGGIFCSTDNIWPGLNQDAKKGEAIVTGPTGVPWVNSNAWFSLLARELAADKTLWLDFDPPDSSTGTSSNQYCLAFADSQAYGSRWIISLDDKLRVGISQKNPQALDTWTRIVETAAFFVNHRDWDLFKSQGILAVVSDFRGDNSFLSGEVLNLLNRSQVQFQIVPRSRLSSASMQGLEAILWVNKEKPTDDQLSKLLAFVQHGGLVIAPEYWGPPGTVPTKKDPSLDYSIYKVGQGQMAVAEEGFQDPYQVAVDTHLLVSRRNDLVRLYNPVATNCHWSVNLARTKGLVQVLNYAPNRADYVTVWVRERASSARLFRPDAKDQQTIQGVTANPGTDFGLPGIAVCCALEFEGKDL